MFTQSMTDLDEFRAVIRPVGSEVIIAGGGKFAAIINRVDLNGLWMQRAQENVPRLMNGWVDRRRASFVFVTHPEHGMVWNGLEALYGGMIMAPPGGDFCQRLPGPTQWGSMSLPVEDLVEIGATLVGQDLTPQRNPRRIIPAPAAIGRLLRIHRAAAELIKNAPEVIANPLARQGLEQAVAQALIRCIVTRDLQNDAVHQYRHHAILRGFRATLEKWGEQAVYISDVCEAIGVPARTLRICCQEYLGMSPHRFLILRRLHLAHRALRNGEMPTTTVTGVATQFGFWELGRFSVAYKSIFAESPSATLRRKAR